MNSDFLRFLVSPCRNTRAFLWCQMSKNKYLFKTINGKKQGIHRHIMEEYLDRSLEKHEHVYHVNGNSKDNRIENLIIIKKKHNK